MTYPFEDRRVAYGDRRTNHERRRNTIAVDRERRENQRVRRSGSDRRQIDLDRQKVLDNLVLLETRDKESTTFKILRLVLLPVVIAVASIGGTYWVNEKQIKSAKIIAQSQKESSERIAQANRDQSAEVAKAELETQKLEQIIDIFTAIIDKPAPGSSVRQKIASLEVYRDQALPFLLRLRKYKMQDDSDRQEVINQAATKSILNILSKSQLDLSYQLPFSGTPQSPLNLRSGKYVDYNLSGSRFTYVNLFRANFSGSTLRGARFENADLVDTDFSGANLEGALFINSRLRRTNFVDAYLRDVTFTGCDSLGDAIFSLKTLLNPKREPISSMGPKTYVKLLSRYAGKLTEGGRTDLQDVYQKAGVTDFDGLMEKLEEVKVSSRASKTTAMTDQVSR